MLVGSAVLAAAQAAPARQDKIVSFRMPSKNIACAYITGFGKPFLRCDLLSGLKPEPRGRCKEGDWSAVEMTRRGKAHPICISDTVYSNRAPVLKYGRTWKKGGFTCKSRKSGLTCKNRAGHGFFLSRERWSVH